jgi:hypothetical protein
MLDPSTLFDDGDYEDGDDGEEEEDSIILKSIILIF